MIHRIFPRMKIVNLALRYPQNYMIRNPLKGALILFLFITSFTLLYQPMNAHGSRWFNFQFTMLIYAFASSMAACLIMWILARTKYFGDRKRWTLPKELLAIYLVLQVMGIAIFMSAFILEEPSEESRWNLQTFVDSCKYAFLIGIIPFLFFTVSNYRYLLTSGGPSFIDLDRDHVAGSEPIIHISSSLKKESLSFRPSELLFVSSDGNYVDFHLYRDADIEKVPIRNSISNIEKQFSDIPVYFRCHRAFIVNLDQVSGKKGNALGYQLTLRHCPEKIPVSRQKVKTFDQLYHP
jgi:hypothetical protein